MPIVPKEALFRKAAGLEPYILPAIVVLVGIGAFGLGRLSASPGHQSLRILYPNAQLASPAAVPATSRPAEVGGGASPAFTPGQEAYVASKSGTKYYLASCSGAARIKAENKVYFTGAAAAEAAGYGPAANCPGL